MNRRIKKHGFTLVELMIALIVASIVLSAVATLAHAAGLANDAADQMGRHQGQLRQLSMRLTDAIKQSNQIVMNYEWGCVLWQDKDADGSYGPGELVVVYRYQFYDTTTLTDQYAVALRPLADDETITAHLSGWPYGFNILRDSDNNFSYETTLIAYSIWAPDTSDAATVCFTSCQSPEFCYFDTAGNVCGTGFNIDARAVMLRFTMLDDGQTQQHCINAHLRTSDDY